MPPPAERLRPKAAVLSCASCDERCFPRAIPSLAGAKVSGLSQRDAADDAEDVALLRATARGDRAAFASLYDRHAHILFGVALRIIRVRHEAEDVLQDTFLQIWQRAGDFDEQRGRVLPWMALLARSRALDRVRSKAFRERPSAADVERAETASAEDPNLDLARAEEGATVRRALVDLTDAQRETLLLAYFEGLSQTEIASRLGKPLGTIKTHARAGLLRLRDSLAGAAPTDRSPS